MWPSACNSLKTGREHGESQAVRPLLHLVRGRGHAACSVLDRCTSSPAGWISSRATCSSTARPKPRSSTTGITISCSPSRARIARTFRSTACRAAMVSAVLTAEDRYFFQHAGMDIIGLARAAWVDLKARAVKQGGSTITQQLIRQVALTHRPQHPAQNQRGAARAARRAPVRQETDPRGLPQSHLSRQRPLRRRGGRARLLRQARLRAQHAPKARCSPASFRAPRSVRRERRRTSPESRRDTVLKAMRENGAITEHEYAEAIASPIALAPSATILTRPRIIANVAHGADATGLHFLEARAAPGDAAVRRRGRV